MEYAIIAYDEFYDIPLRGLLQTEDGTLAFDGCILEDEPADSVGRRGIYAKIRAFECTAELRSILEERDELFRQWRASFDKGEVKEDTHPLYANKRYQELNSRANEVFESLTSPVFERTGFFRVDKGGYVFDSGTT